MSIRKQRSTRAATGSKYSPMCRLRITAWRSLPGGAVVDSCFATIASGQGYKNCLATLLQRCGCNPAMVECWKLQHAVSQEKWTWRSAKPIQLPFYTLNISEPGRVWQSSCSIGPKNALNLIPQNAGFWAFWAVQISAVAPRSSYETLTSPNREWVPHRSKLPCCPMISRLLVPVLVATGCGHFVQAHGCCHQIQSCFIMFDSLIHWVVLIFFLWSILLIYFYIISFI